MSVTLYAASSSLTEELLSEWPLAQNWIFVLFLFCFFISMQSLGASGKLLSSMLYSLFRGKDRQSIFSEPVDNEWISQIILSLQMVILSAVIIYCTIAHVGYFRFETVAQLLRWIGGISALIIVFVLYKFLTNLLTSFIFFQKDSMHLWNDNFFSILSLSGLVLFVPALLMFYVKEAYSFCFYFSLIYFLFVEVLMFYKIFIIFFQHTSRLLYFILYLCAQEFVPLFLAYKALMYIIL
jgi:hypothetical protein